MHRIGDVSIDLGDDHVATVEIHRPPNNFEDGELIGALAAAVTELNGEPECRAIVLCAEGKHFCAGANFGPGAPPERLGSQRYDDAAMLLGAEVPMVAAVQGAAVGAGLGIACSADFRVASPGTRFSAVFAKLGFHHGFGLSVTLPLIVGHQRSLELLYLARRVSGEEALAMGLVDQLVPIEELRSAAHALAAEIAESAPLAVRSIKRTMRGHLRAESRAAIDHESALQDEHKLTNDWEEGVRAMAERRPPVFTGS
jgi:enoyl-CoA hydratase/carnithine racemase